MGGILNQEINPFSMIYDKNTKRFKPGYVDIVLALSEAVQHQTVEDIQAFMEDHWRDITASQLRNIFSKVKKARLNELPLLRAKLAYVRGRTDANKRGMHTLVHHLDELMAHIPPEDTPENKKKLEGFKAFFEAALAYHKYCEKIKPRSSRP